MAIIDDIRSRYRSGSLLVRVIYINIGVFVVLSIVRLVALIVGFDAGVVTQWLQVPAAPAVLLTRPWTVVTYMFVHDNLLHLAFNMLLLYWFGRIFMEFFTPKQLVGLYVLGGLGGAAAYLATMSLATHLWGTTAFLMGASAAILAVVVGIAIIAPDYKISLLLIGSVSLKWLAIILVGIDLLSVDAGNVDGHIAHIGGALVGVLFALLMKRGHDITAPLNTAIDALARAFCRRPTPPGRASKASAAERPTDAQPTEQELDRVLDKIRRSGYSALDDHDRDILFGASRRR